MKDTFTKIIIYILGPIYAFGGPFWIWRALKTGHASSARYGDHDRSKRPIRFWLTVAGYLLVTLIGLLCLFLIVVDQGLI